jgi:hypothetical protein
VSDVPAATVAAPTIEGTRKGPHAGREGVIALSELAGPGGAPAPDVSLVVHRDGVFGARADRDDVLFPASRVHPSIGQPRDREGPSRRDRRRALEADEPHRHESREERPFAQLSRGVRAPGSDRAVSDKVELTSYQQAGDNCDHPR